MSQSIRGVICFKAAVPVLPPSELQSDSKSQNSSVGPQTSWQDNLPKVPELSYEPTGLF